jgi:protein phosphatase
MSIYAEARTHVGHRDYNEDRYLISKPGLYAVVDGMGGHACGAEAAETAVACLDGGKPSSGGELQELVEQAHQDVVKMGLESKCHGTGATVVAALFQDDQIHVVWAGDSRCYRLRDGELSLLTTDHNLYEAVRMGQGKERADALHRYAASRLVLCLGGGERDPIEPWLRSSTVESGDRYLLCSDGVSSQMTEEALAQALGGEDPAQELEKAALYAEVKSDNITSVVIDIKGSQW